MQHIEIHLTLKNKKISVVIECSLLKNFEIVHFLKLLNFDKVYKIFIVI